MNAHPNFHRVASATALTSLLLASVGFAADYYVIEGPQQVRGTFGGGRELLTTSQALYGVRAAAVSPELDKAVALDADRRLVSVGLTTGIVTTLGMLPGAEDLAIGDGYYLLSSTGVSRFEPGDGSSELVVPAALLPAGARELAVRERPGSQSFWIGGGAEVRRIDVTGGGAVIGWSGAAVAGDIATATTRQGMPVTLVLTATTIDAYIDDPAFVEHRGAIAIDGGLHLVAPSWHGGCPGGWCVDGAAITASGLLVTLDLEGMTKRLAGSNLNGFPVLAWGLSSEKIAIASTDESGDPHTARIQVLAPLAPTPKAWDLPGSSSGHRVDVGDILGSDSGGAGDGTTDIIESVYSPSGSNQTTDHLALWKIDGNGGLVKVATAQPYGTHTYGATVAAGNVTFESGDPTQGDEILTGPGPGSMHGPQVRAFSASTGALVPISKVNYYAYGTLRYGVNVAAHGGAPPQFWLTGAGPGTIFGPHVRGWKLDNNGQLTPVNGINFFAYQTLRYGVEPDQGDVDRNECDDIVTGPGPGFVFAAQVRGFSWNWAGSVKPIASINVFLTDNHGRTGYYGARAAFIDASESMTTYNVAGSMGSDPTMSYPNVRLMGLGQSPVSSKDVNTGWPCVSCALYLGSNQR